MIDLIEYGEEVLINKGSYNEDDRIFLSKLQYEEIEKGECRYYIRENHEGIYIKPLNYVGTIQLSGERINIFPRFDHNFKSLLNMILFTKDIKYKYFKQNLKVTGANNDLYEIIISLLLGEILNILNSNIFREYVNFNENLKVIRGRIDFNNHLKKNFLRGDSIYCKYDELNPDVIENQIILKALNIALHITNDQIKKKTIKKYAGIFKELCHELKGRKVPKISYNRLNSQYEEAHYYCKLLIECIGAENLYKSGEHNNRYSLLIDMNELFEMFVAKLLSKYLKPHYDIKPQLEISDAILNEKKKTYRKIKPDIVLINKKDRTDCIVIDTKNKAYGNNKVYNEDIYQLSFYGMYFYNMYKFKANIYIIYPQYANDNGKNEKIYINTIEQSLDKPFINVRSIDINEYLELIERELSFKEELKDRLLKIIS